MRDAREVPCPWPTCRASIGSACTTLTGRPLAQLAHDARLVAAGLADWITINGVQRAVMRRREDLTS